jgi:branched-chain amino acid transport system substrate-binding protein
MTAPLCLNSTVIDALGDWSKWTYAIASSLYGDPTDKGMPAYEAVIKRYKAQKNAPDPWHIVAFSQLLTTVRFLNEVGAKNVNAITPGKVLVRAKAFRGPLALGAPKLQCGKYKDAPAICNDMFQAFTYEGKFQFKRASGWIGPLPG